MKSDLIKNLKEIFSSIRVRVWFLFICFALAIIAFLYFFQIGMLSTYYEHMKTKETSETVSIIKNAWYNDFDNLHSIVDELCFQRQCYIEISDTNRVYVRVNRIDRKNNNQIQELIESFDESEMEKIVSGKDTLFTTTVPKTQNDSKALIMVTTIAENGFSNESIVANGAVRVFVFNYLEPLGTTVEIINSQLRLAAVIIILCAFILSIFFSNSISNPIIQITRAAKTLPQGKYIPENKKIKFSEISELNDTLYFASGEIAKSDNLRKELMANISHDLRTPLTMIKAYAEMIRDLSGNNPEKREKHLQVIIDETDRLSSLVTDILDLSKLQSGVTEMSLEKIDFSEHLNDLVSRFSLLNEIKDYNIILKSEPDIIISADITKIDQVIYNFINNAITYCGEDNTVIVNLYRSNSCTARFEVKDNGVGIDEENLKYIWDRYYKVKKDGETHKRAVKGSGLGLSIVKGVLEMHGFKYGADSTVGQGSVFWFEAPLTEIAHNDSEKTSKSKSKHDSP